MLWRVAPKNVRKDLLLLGSLLDIICLGANFCLSCLVVVCCFGVVFCLCVCFMFWFSLSDMFWRIILMSSFPFWGSFLSLSLCGCVPASFCIFFLVSFFRWFQETKIR